MSLEDIMMITTDDNLALAIQLYTHQITHGVSLPELDFTKLS